MIKKLSRVFVLASAAALVSLSAGPAQALSVPVRGESGVYHLAVELADGTVRDTTLVCPGGHGHPHGADVCAQLSEVNGEVGALSSRDSMCTLEYRPVKVRAHGVWEGRFHSYEGEFGNYCTAVGLTGGQLFDLADS